MSRIGSMYGSTIALAEVKRMNENVEVGASSILVEGKGLFAVTDFPLKGDLICFYLGSVISEEEATTSDDAYVVGTRGVKITPNKPSLSDNRFNTDPLSFAAFINDPVGTSKTSNCQFMGIYFVIAESQSEAEDPNGTPPPAKKTKKNISRADILAVPVRSTRPIKAGEELFIDYGKEKYWAENSFHAPRKDAPADGSETTDKAIRYYHQSAINMSPLTKTPVLQIRDTKIVFTAAFQPEVDGLSNSTFKDYLGVSWIGTKETGLTLSRLVESSSQKFSLPRDKDLLAKILNTGESLSSYLTECLLEQEKDVCIENSLNSLVVTSYTFQSAEHVISEAADVIVHALVQLDLKYKNDHEEIRNVLLAHSKQVAIYGIMSDENRRKLPLYLALLTDPTNGVWNWINTSTEIDWEDFKKDKINRAVWVTLEGFMTNQKERPTLDLEDATLKLCMQKTASFLEKLYTRVSGVVSKGKKIKK